ncbi:hypothetical protein ACX3VG_10385, partial [Escherichia coli]
AANWASLKADDAQHAITVAQTDIDANKAAITDTRNDVSAVQSLSLIHISEPTRLDVIAYAVLCLKRGG